MIAGARKREKRATAKLRARPREVVVMRMVRKWASCSRRGRVCFARDLLDQPSGGQDYVIVHELLHLRHANHGRVFRSLLRTHLPHWQVWAEALPPRISRRPSRPLRSDAMTHGPSLGRR